jgi:putative RNA 2'-phosphotransferase
VAPAFQCAEQGAQSVRKPKGRPTPGQAEGKNAENSKLESCPPFCLISPQRTMPPRCAFTDRPGYVNTGVRSQGRKGSAHIVSAWDSLQLSKFLSFVLRHKPESIGISLDSQGWVSVDDLIAKSQTAGTHFTREDLLHVVETSDKKRFSLSAGARMIRAAQGHSVAVDLGLAPQEPPAILYHGTATRFVGAILAEGLKPGARQQVHLSAHEATAQRVGQRHGKPAILKVDALGMHRQGFKFSRSDNGVWLIDRVPPEFLS